MTGFIPFFKKELKEQFRTHRLLIVGGILLFFGLTTPLLLKYLPQIIELSGQTVPVDIPPPTAVDSLASYAGTISQIGVLIAVLIAMGSIANEIRSGAAVIILSKQITRASFVSAKLIAMSITFLISLTLAAFFCFAYTVWLIGTADALAFLELNLLLTVFLVFCLAVTVLFSSLFRSSLAAGGIAIGVIIAQGLLSTAPVIGNFLPGKLLGWGTGLFTSSNSYWGALAVACSAIVLCVYFAQRILRSKEL